MRGKEKLITGTKVVTLLMVCMLVFVGISILPVKVRAASKYPYITKTKNGLKSDNSWGHEYGLYWSTKVNSYLVRDEQGSFTRIEFMQGEKNSKVYIEDWSANFKLQNSKTITAELPGIGGFYSGKDYNYIVFSKSNPKQSDSAEVMRIVKYEKNWKRVGKCSVYGANTLALMVGGSLRMSETGGKLIIHTCHTMYTSADGLNHQANMTVVVDENTMKEIKIRNVSRAYSSHSFNQFVLSDEENIYFLNHGDAYPRAAVLTKAPIDDEMSASKVVIHTIGGNYQKNGNETGLCLGGMITSGNKILIAGSSVNQQNKKWNAYIQQNIFVTITDKNLSTPVTRQLTHYSDSAGMIVGNPYIVKATDEVSYLLWAEGTDEDNTWMRVARINNNTGNMEYCSKKIFGTLSDCEPLYIDGKIIWYTTDGCSYPKFYKLDTTKLDSYTWVKPVKKSTEKKIPIGTKVKQGKVTYRITSQNTVEYVKSSSIRATVSIASSVTIKKKKYQITSIASSAFKNNKTIRKVIIPKTIKRIGSKAFFGCKNLKNIIIKSKFLSSSNIGKNALTGVSQKVKVKVPKKQYKKYKKLLRKKGLSKKAVIKK